MEKQITDISAFHYYEKPQTFTVEYRVTGTASITVQANTRDEAERLADAQIDAEGDNYMPDLEAVDDVEHSFTTANPTRMYLVRNASKPSVSATSRIGSGDEPREPTEDDRKSAERLGYVMSWASAEIGGAA